jgi:hypothetical protein
MPRTTPSPQTILRDARSAAMAQGLERVAWLMDRAITIPGTKITVGLDALLGLLPVGGDVLTGIVQSAVVLTALYHYRVPRAVAARMATNVLLDITLGAVPFLGDVFDVFFKANTRNLALLKQVQEHQSKGEAVPSAPSVRYLLLLGALFGGAIVLVAGGLIYLIVRVVDRPLF